MAQDISNPQPTRQKPPENPALKQMDVLVGKRSEWKTEISAPAYSNAVVQGRTSFEWLEGGAFLVERWNVAHPDFPDGIAIIGCEDPSEICSMHYFDSRGVSRIYQMSLSDGIWKIWRDAPGFSQRFTGTFSEDGNRIIGFWEKTTDGAHWEHDFDMTYTRVKTG